MKEQPTNIRLMRPGDFDAVVAIDERILKTARPEYYEVKFEKIVESSDSLPISLVAENRDGSVVGFVMGELYMGQYGIFESEATIDTIGVDPQAQQHSLGRQLIDAFVDHVSRIGVRKIRTLVSADDKKLTKFFKSNQFSPSRNVNLERAL
ncbi:MAG: GNAT family N-acetyltransferase [Deferrisomatales bacterium]|nr:GNAT family N-acetyltransferase [Deferrisomatales bacterium]